MTLKPNIPAVPSLAQGAPGSPGPQTAPAGLPACEMPRPRLHYRTAAAPATAPEAGSGGSDGSSPAASGGKRSPARNYRGSVQSFWLNWKFVSCHSACEVLPAGAADFQSPAFEYRRPQHRGFAHADPESRSVGESTKCPRVQ